MRWSTVSARAAALCRPRPSDEGGRDVDEQDLQGGPVSQHGQLPVQLALLALDAIQILGGNGYINDYPTGRLLRDAKLYEIGAGTSEIRRMLIGRELFAETA